MPHAQQIVLFPNVPATLDADLEPVAPVIVNVVVLDDGAFGGLVDVAAEVIVLDGSAILSYAWTQTAGAPAILTGAGTDLVTLTLATRLEYKEQLFAVLTERWWIVGVLWDREREGVTLPADLLPGAARSGA